MDRILVWIRPKTLAKEYRQLSYEQITLTEKLASVEARSEPEAEPAPVEEEVPEDRIYHMADGITPPVLLERVEPVYPELDRQMRRQGRVVVLILIGTDGSIEQARRTLFQSMDGYSGTPSSRAVEVLSGFTER